MQEPLPQTIQTLIKQSCQQIVSQYDIDINHKTLHINDYIDRQLKHLVVTEEFDFGQITYLIGLMFPEYKYRINKKYCEERWTQMHLVRKYRLDQKLKENRKLMAIMSFQDPKKFLTAKELIKELEIQEYKRQGEINKEDNQQNKKNKEDIFDQIDKIEQFNITKDKIKKISAQKYKEMQDQYLQALQKAREISEDMYQKPFVYKPKFIIDNNYELEREDLTEEKAKQIVCSDIRLDSKIVGDFKDHFYESKFKNKNQNQEKEKEQMKENYKPRSKGIFAHLQNQYEDEENSDFQEDQDY